MKKSLLEIEKEFREIAESNNVVGDSVEVLIKLLSYNRYESQTSVDNTLLEFLPDTAVNINSKLEHAMNEMYSVGRGYNAKVMVEAIVTGNVVLEKYQRVYSDKSNTLFFLGAKLDGIEVTGDYQFIYGKTYELILLKAEKMYTEIVTVDSNNKYLIEILDDDISDEYTLRDGTIIKDEVPTTKDFGKHIDSSIHPTLDEPALAFDLTTPGYGLRIYAPDSHGFSTSESYTINYFKFLDEVVDIDDLLKIKIPGFKLNIESLKIEQRLPREATSNFLYNLKKELISQSRVRSNSDIVDTFRKYFSQKIKDASMNEYDIRNDRVTINYIPILSNNLVLPYDDFTEIDDVEMQTYLDALMYYVTKDIVKVAIRDDSAIQVRLELSIVISDLIDSQHIIDVVNKYEYKLGMKMNKDEFVGDINNIPGVRYCSLKIFHLHAPDPNHIGAFIDIEVNDIKSPINKYFLMTPHLNYTYRR